MVLFKLVTTNTEYFVDGFTFHYGPIQICIYNLVSLISAKFTFHYGPIQIVLQLIFANM